MRIGVVITLSLASACLPKPQPLPTATIRVTVVDNEIILDWPPVDRAERYAVHWRAGRTVSAEDERLAPLRPPYHHRGLSYGGTYSYLARAQVGDIFWDLAEPVVVTLEPEPPEPPEPPEDLLPPPAPVGLVASASGTTITLTWEEAAGAESYDVSYDLVTFVDTPAATKILNVSSGWAHEGLRTGTTYYYRVIANNTAGASPLSAEAAATTVPSPPRNVEAFGEQDGVRLWWDPARGADGYDVFYGLLGDPANTRMSDCASPCLVPSTLASRQALVVVAKNDAGESAPSAPAVAINHTDKRFSRQMLVQPSDGQNFSYFGYTVRLSEDRLLVGAPFEDLSEVDNAGAVYVFRRETITWREEAKLVAPSPQSNTGFGEVMAIAGDTVVLGAPFGAADDAVHIFGFVASPSGWSFVQTLQGNGVGLFGRAIALVDDALFVAAADGIHVYTRQITGLFEGTLVLLDPGAAAGGYGNAVDADGDWLAVGAPDEPAAEADFPNGAVYLYRLPIGNTQPDVVLRPTLQYSTPDVEPPPYYFGVRVALRSDRLLVMANDSPQTMVYEHDGDSWQRTMPESEPMPATTTLPGHGGDINAVYAATVVSSQDACSPGSKGCLHVAKLTGSSWYINQYPYDGPGFLFGSISIFGETIAVGVLPSGGADLPGVVIYEIP